jgi:Flp pilus assembly protein TadB
MNATTAGFIALFSIGMTILIREGLMYWRNWRLRHRRFSFLSSRSPWSRFTQRSPWLIALDRKTAMAGLVIRAETFCLASTLFSIPGFLWGWTTFGHSLMGPLFGLISGSFPFMFLLFKIYLRQKGMAALMIPTFQVFLGVYSSTPNVRICLQKSATLMPSFMRYEFQWLTNAIHTGIPFDEALYEYAARVGNEFAEDFADLLIIADERGEDIQKSLMNLINRTQNEKFNTEMEQTELIDIRYGTLVIIGLTLFLIFYNIHLGENPFYSENRILTFYTKTSTGQTVVSLVAIVQFIAFIGSIWVARRKL